MNSPASRHLSLVLYPPRAAKTAESAAHDLRGDADDEKEAGDGGGSHANQEDAKRHCLAEPSAPLDCSQRLRARMGAPGKTGQLRGHKGLRLPAIPP